MAKRCLCFLIYCLLLLLLSRFSHVHSVRPQRRQPTRLHCPWDSSGKNIGVGCHFLLQCMKVESESEVTQPCLTLRDPMDCSPPGSSIHGILQARVLEWGAIAFSAGPALSALQTSVPGSSLNAQAVFVPEFLFFSLTNLPVPWGAPFPWILHLPRLKGIP